jgi:hypothetical protein
MEIHSKYMTNLMVRGYDDGDSTELAQDMNQYELLYGLSV